MPWPVFVVITLATLPFVAVEVSPSWSQQTALPADHLFDTHHTCIACHNGLVTSSGEDVSLGFAWRASMMANSARDPLLAGRCKTRDDRSPRVPGRNRRRVFEVPHADGALFGECERR